MQEKKGGKLNAMIIGRINIIQISKATEHMQWLKWMTVFRAECGSDFLKLLLCLKRTAHLRALQDNYGGMLYLWLYCLYNKQ